jgi:hypothetical protein
MFAELVGNGFFLEFISCGNFLVQKSEKQYVQKDVHFSVFLGRQFRGKKMGIK